MFTSKFLAYSTRQYTIHTLWIKEYSSTLTHKYTHTQSGQSHQIVHPLPQSAPLLLCTIIFLSETSSSQSPCSPHSHFTPTVLIRGGGSSSMPARVYTIICLNTHMQHKHTHTHTALVLIGWNQAAWLAPVSRRAGSGSNLRLYCADDGLNRNHYLMVLKGPTQTSAPSPARPTAGHILYPPSTSIIKMQNDVFRASYTSSFHFRPWDIAAVWFGAT